VIGVGAKRGLLIYIEKTVHKWTLKLYEDSDMARKAGWTWRLNFLQVKEAAIAHVHRQLELQ
jgi:hypothetical protein